MKDVFHFTGRHGAYPVAGIYFYRVLLRPWLKMAAIYAISYAAWATEPPPRHKPLSLIDHRGTIWYSAPDHLTALSIALPSPVVTTCSGFSHTLALDKQGDVWAWGDNSAGQLGSGNTAPTSGPVHLNLHHIAQIACGAFHSLARSTDGAVWAWGANTLGQVGTGDAGAFEVITVPTQPVGLSNTTAVAAGNSFSMAQNLDGSVWLWGNGNHTAPTRLLGLSNTIIIQTRGDTAMALEKNGHAFQWENIAKHPEYVLPANLNAEDFDVPGISPPTAHLVDGSITRSGLAVPHVPLFTQNQICAYTNGTGHYTCLLPLHKNITVTPQLKGYVFTALKAIEMSADETQQDFVMSAPLNDKKTILQQKNITLHPTVTSNSNPSKYVTLKPAVIKLSKHQLITVLAAKQRPPSQTNNTPLTQPMGETVVNAGVSKPIIQTSIPPVDTLKLTGNLAGSASNASGDKVNTTSKQPQIISPPLHFILQGNITEGGRTQHKNKPMTGISFVGLTCSEVSGKGSFSCSVPENWSGNLVPLRHNYRFYPTSRSYTKINEDINNQDFNTEYSPN